MLREYRLATSRPHEFLSERSELFRPRSDEGLFWKSNEDITVLSSVRKSWLSAFSFTQNAPLEIRKRYQTILVICVGIRGGTPHMKGVWMLVRNFELTPKGDRSGRGPRFLWTPKRDHVKTQTIYIYIYIFSHSTLNETYTAKYESEEWSSQ